MSQMDLQGNLDIKGVLPKNESFLKWHPLSNESKITKFLKYRQPPQISQNYKKGPSRPLI